MIKVFVVYEQKPDPERYAAHVELCRRVEGAPFRHGPVFGSPFGEPGFQYYAEWDFPDMDAFETATRTREFAEAGKDAVAMGLPFHVHFADVSE